MQNFIVFTLKSYLFLRPICHRRFEQWIIGHRLLTISVCVCVYTRVCMCACVFLQEVKSVDPLLKIIFLRLLIKYKYSEATNTEIQFCPQILLWAESSDWREIACSSTDNVREGFFLSELSVTVPVLGLPTLASFGSLSFHGC